MNEKKPFHCDTSQQQFLDAAVALLLLCGFFHVTEISVHRHDIDIRLKLDEHRKDRHDHRDNEDEEF